MRFPWPILVLPLAACNPAPPQAAFRASGEVIAFGGGDGGAANACFTCHGMKGEGDGRETPRLAGLDAGYAQRQLDDYVNGRREHKVMRAVARRLTLEDRAKVSAYYAALSVPAVSAKPPPVSPLYRTSCASCHGTNGEGNLGNPPLAGQPAAYLERQLIAWRTAKRYNDALGEMREISRRLTPAEVRAVAAHAAALPGTHPIPVPEASP